MNFKGWSFGTPKHVDGGVAFSRGKGKNKTVHVIGFAEIAAWAKSHAAEVKELAESIGPGRAAEALRKQLVTLMKTSGGQFGVGKFTELDDFTKRWKDAMGYPQDPIGAGLGKNAMIKKWKNGTRQFVGWTDGSRGRLAEKFQDGEGGSTDPFVRGPGKSTSRFVLKCYARGIDDDYIPQAYVHRQRPVIEPFGRHIDENLETFKRQVIDKEIAKRLAIDKGIAVRKAV